MKSVIRFKDSCLFNDGFNKTSTPICNERALPGSDYCNQHFLVVRKGCLKQDCHSPIHRVAGGVSTLLCRGHYSNLNSARGSAAEFIDSQRKDASESYVMTWLRLGAPVRSQILQMQKEIEEGLAKKKEMYGERLVEFLQEIEEDINKGCPVCWEPHFPYCDTPAVRES